MTDRLPAFLRTLRDDSGELYLRGGDLVAWLGDMIDTDPPGPPLHDIVTALVEYRAILADSVLAYIPSTGEPPADLKPGEVFCHRMVPVGPPLAETLLKTLNPNVRPISWTAVAIMTAAMSSDPPTWEYSSGGNVQVNDRGEVVGGKAILEAVRQSGATVELDVWHNVPWHNLPFAEPRT